MTARSTVAGGSARATSFRERYGPWAVVTGASEGIGREFARELAALQIDLVLISRRRGLLETLARELEATHGIEYRVLSIDLGDPGATAAIEDATAALDVGLLVAAAGFGTSGPFLAADLPTEQSMLAVNCSAVLDLTSTFGRRFADRGRGGLVLMSSVLAFQGVARSAHYAATKSYVQSLAEGLHEELRWNGVDVVSAAPGPIRSGFGARADMHMGIAGSPVDVARETIRALGRRTTVRPGMLSKVLAVSLALLPRWGRVKVLGLVMKGMTAHQASADRTTTRTT